MLKLDTSIGSEITVERARKKLFLSRLKKQLRSYFGFTSVREVAEAFALRDVVGERQQQRLNQDVAANVVTNVQAAVRDVGILSDPEIANVFSQIIDDGDDAKKYLDTSTGESLKKTIQQNLVNIPANELETKLSKYARCIKMHYSKEIANHSSVSPQIAFSSQTGNPNQNCLFFNDLDKALPFTAIDGDQATVNEVKKRIVAVRMEHPLLTPGEKNSELLTLFFNAMPTLEMTRATPVMNVTIYSARPPITENGRLSAITLQKFLEGAVEQPQGNENAALRALNLASQVSSNLVTGSFVTADPVSDFVVTGLELFRSPQTLQNIDETKKSANQREKYLSPVIDPFRPLASIKAFSVDMQSTYGLMGSRTGTLEIVLHDRSRLGEFANFIKPDRYGTAFLEIEYGWSHPDPLESNPYADLLNLTRVKDHFNIVTTNLSFDEVGQVSITLNLVGRGISETTEVSIVGPNDANRIQTQIREIENLSTTINQLASQVYSHEQLSGENTNNNTHRQEIRGLQGLNAAQDAVNNLVLTSDTLREVREIQQSLQSQRSTRGIQRDLADKLTRLNNSIRAIFGEINANNQPIQNDRNPSAIRQFQSSINQEIRTILQNINNDLPNNSINRNNYYNDPFLKTIKGDIWTKLTDGRDGGQIDEHNDAIRAQEVDLTVTQNSSSPPPVQRPAAPIPDTTTRTGNPRRNRNNNNSRVGNNNNQGGGPNPTPNPTPNVADGRLPTGTNRDGSLRYD